MKIRLLRKLRKKANNDLQFQRTETWNGFKQIIRAKYWYNAFGLPIYIFLSNDATDEETHSVNKCIRNLKRQYVLHLLNNYK